MSKEYLAIIDDIINNEDFKKLQQEKHHYYTNRYAHSCNVALKTYKMCKRLNLDYITATRAALVHDFFYNDEFDKNKEKIIHHYKKSIENASKIMDLTEEEKHIIASHMFPIGGMLPKTKEAIVVDLCDDIVSVKEHVVANRERVKLTTITFFTILFSFFN